MPYKNPPELYSTWAAMLSRCRNPNSRQWKDYGGRGIGVCERWREFRNFEADMGPRPSGMTLDRIDNDGDYEPGNCRWTTRKEQQRNQRRAVYVTIDGKRYRAVELAEQYGLKTDTIVSRAAKGLSFADVTIDKRHVFREGLSLGGQASGAKKRARTHCLRGHPYSTENARLTKQGWRWCRLCHNEKVRRLSAAKRARDVRR